MKEIRRIRLRAGAVSWELYQDLTHPDRWTESWVVDSWTEHLRHATRLDDADRASIAQAVAMHRGIRPVEASRHLRVEP
jgi:hypothetical protein